MRLSTAEAACMPLVAMFEDGPTEIQRLFSFELIPEVYNGNFLENPSSYRVSPYGDG